LLVEDYDRMYVEQEGLCYVCGQPEKSKRGGKLKALGVDHNHKTGEVRRLLCTRCNAIVGLSGESSIILEKVINYLRQFGG
jgi:hypothetical protein